MNDFRVTKHLDWVQFTLHEMVPLSKEVTKLVDVLPSPKKQYQWMHRLDCGGEIHTPLEDLEKSQGWLYVFTGLPTGMVRQIAGDEFLIEFASDHDAKITRLDFCVNIHNSDQTIKDVDQMLDQHKYKTLARDVLPFQPKHKPMQGYQFGSKHSDRWGTFYDKGFEQKNDSRHLRAELKTYREKAQAMFLDMLEMGIPIGGTNHLKEYMHFTEWGDWHKAINQDYTGELSKVGRKKSSYLSWLDIVLQSINGKFDDPRYRPAIRSFLDAIDDGYEKVTAPDGQRLWMRAVYQDLETDEDFPPVAPSADCT